MNSGRVSERASGRGGRGCSATGGSVERDAMGADIPPPLRSGGPSTQAPPPHSRFGITARLSRLGSDRGGGGRRKVDAHRRGIFTFVSMRSMMCRGRRGAHLRRCPRGCWQRTRFIELVFISIFIELVPLTYLRIEIIPSQGKNSSRSMLPSSVPSRSQLHSSSSVPPRHRRGHTVPPTSAILAPASQRPGCTASPSGPLSAIRAALPAATSHTYGSHLAATPGPARSRTAPR